MDPTTLERLLIDRRLGELPPDTAALLDAYLQVEAGGRAMAEELEKSIAAAERALKAEPPARDWPMPPMAGTTVMRRSERRRPVRPAMVWTRRLAVAAGIVLAFFIGNRTGSNPRSNQHPMVVNNQPRIAPTAPRLSEGDGFWSLQRLQKSVGSGHEPNRQHLEWPAPFSKPRIGERT